MPWWFIHFSDNPQLQYAFARILEEEADGFNLELGIDTCCVLAPELFSQLLQPFIAQRPLCYKDFEIGALQQVCSENYVFCIVPEKYAQKFSVYKAKKTDVKPIQCEPDTVFSFLNKGEDIIINVLLNRTFYLWCQKGDNFCSFGIVIWRFKTMNYLENKTLFHAKMDVDTPPSFKTRDVDIPVMISVRYVSYTSTLQFFAKLVGADNKKRVMEAGEPLTLTKF